MSKWPARSEVSFTSIDDRLVRLTATRRSSKGTETWLHAYALLGDRGVVLFEGPDRPGFYEDHQQFFDDNGGLALLVLTHDGQASAGHARAISHWNGAVMLDARDEARGRANGLGDLDIVQPAESSTWGFESIHLPGHTKGFTAFQVTGARSSYLVTSHFLRQAGRDGWVSFIHPYLVAEAFASLDRLRDVRADHLLPEGTNRDPGPPIPFAGADRADIVDRASEYLRRKVKAATSAPR